MSQSLMRQPPRFVPTLTEVVPDEQPTSVAFNPPMHADADHSVSELYVEDALPLVTKYAEEVPVNGSAANTHDVWVLAAQSIQARVMEQVDTALEQRLHHALAEMVQLHTQSLYQALRMDIEQLVSTAVQEVLAQELEQIRNSEGS